MAAREKLHREHPASMADLLLSMYTLIPPRRLVDYRDVNVFTRRDVADRGNYIVLHKNGEANMVIHEHKTSKRYGPYRTTLPRALGRLIYESIQKYPRAKLIVDPSNGRIFGNATSDDGTMSRYLKEVTKNALGKEVGIGIIALRRLFVSSLDMQHMTVAQLKEIAYAMGHSSDMQMRYRVVRGEEGIEELASDTEEAGPSNRPRRAAVPHSDQAGPSDPRPRLTPVTPGVVNTVVRVTSALRAVPQQTPSDEAIPQPPQVVVVPQEAAQVVHAQAASPAASTAASSHQPSQRSYTLPPFGQVDEFEANEAHSAPHAQVVVVQPMASGEAAENDASHAEVPPAPQAHAHSDAAQSHAHAGAAQSQAARKRKIAEVFGHFAVAVAELAELFPGTELTFKLKL